MLINESADYMRGFRLGVVRRPADTMTPVEAVDPVDLNFPSDGRIAPVSRLAAAFLDAIENGKPTAVGFAQGLRVQVLLHTARRANNLGRWLDIAPEIMERRL
jgi:predicted dehydrogenase